MVSVPLDCVSVSAVAVDGRFSGKQRNRQCPASCLQTSVIHKKPERICDFQRRVVGLAGDRRG
jgi:hypothetical protein